MNKPIEIEITEAVKKLLSVRVNELLNESDLQLPLIEFTNYTGTSAVVPEVNIFNCKQTEKERLIKLNTYTMIIYFQLPENIDSEIMCYVYSAALSKAVEEDTTIGGIVDKTIITEKKYRPPKEKNNGEGWELSVWLHLSIENRE